MCARSIFRIIGRVSFLVVGLGLLLLAALATGALLLSSSSLEKHADRVGIVFYTEAQPDLSERLELAFQLWKAGKIGKIVAVGGWRPKSRTLGSSDMAHTLVARGIPAEQVRHDLTSNDTISNLEAALVLTEDLASSSPVLISDRLHVLRIRILARRLRPDVDWLVAPTDQPILSIRLLHRAFHETLAWLSYLLPDSVRRHLLEKTRRGTLAAYLH